MVDLYKQYGRVFGFFKSRGFSTEEARDLTQETLLRAWKKLRTLQSPDAIAHWIRRIAANIGNNELRSRKALKRAGAQLSLEELAQGAGADELTALEAREVPGQLDGLITAELLAVTQRCIEALPPLMRQCLRLYAYHGLTYQEIADILQIPINTVKTNIHDGRSVLRQRVEQLLAGGPDAIS